MADLVDNMTAAELRTKLAEYGLPVMPITASTRNLMVKKLKLVMEGKGDSKNVDSRRSLAKYSSGEDSDMDMSKTVKEKAKNRRATVGGAMLPPASNKLRRTTPKKSDSPAKIDNDKDSESETEPVKTHEEVKTVTTRRITRTFKPSITEQEDYETGSDSDVDNKPSSAFVDNKTTSSSGYKSSFTTSLPYKSITSRGDYISSTLPPTTISHDSPPSPTYSSYTSSSDLNSIRSRLGLTQTYGERPALSTSYTSNYSSSYKPATTLEEIDSPYLSSFTRRLSSLKATDLRSSAKDTDNTNGSSGYVGKSYYKPSFKRHGDYSPDFKAAGEKNIFKTNLVSFAIVGIGLVFFLGVSFLYLGMKGDVALHIEDKNNIIPLCQKLTGMRASENCVEKENVPKALDLLKIIYPELHSRAVTAGCGDSGQPIHMTLSDIVEFVKKDFKNASETQIREDLHNLHVLILNNPRWGISILALDESKPDKSTVLRSIDYVMSKRSQGQTALAMLNPIIPWRCSVTQYMYHAIIVILTLALAGSGAYGVHKLVKTYIDYRKNRKDQIYSMVEQIIDLLSQENTEEGADPAGQSMAISHVRDMLIAPQNREKMTDIWDEAIKFIEKNESRVRFEVERVAGEEYRALRWVSPQGSPRARGPGARSWQGQAFETQEGSVNNLTISPTPCLKIRHMVDKNDKNSNLKSVIQDAILEKCGPNCKILHIEIDKVSCCVYVKCASPADAGIVYQNLHGWWYEGNLITVKYLRLERYMDHFPSSPSTGPFLKPSSQQ